MARSQPGGASYIGRVIDDAEGSGLRRFLPEHYLQVLRTRKRIPTGFRHPAQGCCNPGITPPPAKTPKGLRPSARGHNPVGVGAWSSGNPGLRQPWAGGRNPVWIWPQSAPKAAGIAHGVTKFARSFQQTDSGNKKAAPSRKRPFQKKQGSDSGHQQNLPRLLDLAGDLAVEMRGHSR